MGVCTLVDIGRMTWEGEEYSVNDIDVALTSFGSSEGAIDPDNWLSGAVDVLDAETWFQTSETATRRVSNRPLVSVGAGLRPAPPVVLAANITARSREALSNGGWRGGISASHLDCHDRGTSDVWRFPASNLENNWVPQTCPLGRIAARAANDRSAIYCFLPYEVPCFVSRGVLFHGTRFPCSIRFQHHDHSFHANHHPWRWLLLVCRSRV